MVRGEVFTNGLLAVSEISLSLEVREYHHQILISQEIVS